MIFQVFSKRKELNFERMFPVPVERVWDALTRPEELRQWWGPPKISVVECDVDLRIGGGIHIVMEAGEEMGKYRGTRWPMSGTFTLVEDQTRLAYDARSWTEGEEEATTIEHSNDITLHANDKGTTVRFQVSITSIGPKAKMAAFGMKWGYQAQLEKLEAHLG